MSCFSWFAFWVLHIQSDKETKNSGEQTSKKLWLVYEIVKNDNKKRVCKSY